MQEPENRRSARDFRITITIVASILCLCIILILLILYFFGFNTGQGFATIYYDVVTTAFTIALFAFGYYQWRITHRQRQFQPDHEEHAFRRPRNMLGFRPFTHAKVIQKCSSAVMSVYEKLIQDDATPIVLTGIAGVGKSILAGLICEHAEEQRKKKQGIFTEEPLWIEIDQATTINDLAFTFFEALNTFIRNFNDLALQQQVMTLFQVLNETDLTRLIVINQLDRLLDLQTGHVRTEHQAVGEWLQVILSQPCKCRFLLTSRVYPVGQQGYNITGENEFYIEGLEKADAMQLLLTLRENKVDLIDELDKALTYCNNHPLSLRLLAEHLSKHHLELADFFNDSAHIKCWKDQIIFSGADGGLHSVFAQLTQLQHEVLLSFSVFRKPVPRSAAQIVLKYTMNRVRPIAISLILPPISDNKILQSCRVLLRQHLLSVPEGYEDSYRLHPLVCACAKDQFDQNDEETNKAMLQLAYAEAAKYYVQQAQKIQALNSDDLRLSYIIEAIWHHCQAEHCHEAYELMDQEKIPSYLRKQNENTLLIDLCLRILASERCHLKPPEKLGVYMYLGETFHALNNNQKATVYYDRAIEIAREMNDSNRERNILTLMSELSQNQEDD